MPTDGSSSAVLYPPEYTGGAEFRYADPVAERLPLPAGLRFDDESMRCAETAAPPPARPMRGVSIGGWLVLEPWITPSLFYQFLGADEAWGPATAQHVGMDHWSFCEALGPEEGNRQLRRHWEAWVTEEHVRALAARGLDTLRIPVGDWMWAPYGPYRRCTDGARAQLQRLLRLCARHGLRALLDLHCVRGSQNGMDNSGRTTGLVWSEDGRSFEHWTVQGAEWLGGYNATADRYAGLDYGRLERALGVLAAITDAHAHDPTVVGLTPLNEPYGTTPLGPLQRFYWEGYKLVQRRAPHWLYPMHPRMGVWPTPGLPDWSGFMRGCPGALLDVHNYLAWLQPADARGTLARACWKGGEAAVRAFEREALPLVIGEWSLATDNCALWLSGFNDNVPGFPKVRCDWVACARPYMGEGQPGAPPDARKGAQGPFGTGGNSTPVHGLCPVDRAWPLDDAFTAQLGANQLRGYSAAAGGWFFWNFRTELEPKWDYVRATSRGWLPMDPRADVADTCPPPRAPPPPPPPPAPPSALAAVCVALGCLAALGALLGCALGGAALRRARRQRGGLLPEARGESAADDGGGGGGDDGVALAPHGDGHAAEAPPAGAGPALY